jgi:integrase/recombinase XerD
MKLFNLGSRPAEPVPAAEQNNQSKPADQIRIPDPFPNSTRESSDSTQDSTDAARMLFAAASEPFLIHCQVERQYSTESLGKMRECLRSWLLPRFGSFAVADLRPVHILAFRAAMAARNLSVARQYSLLMTLKLFLKFCRTVLEIDCLDPASIRLPKRTAPKVEYLTNPEIQALRECIDTWRISGVRMRALFETLLATGMRISEALSLNRDSIDPSTKQTAIVGKGGKKRTIFFSDDALRWTAKYVERRSDLNPALFVTYGANPKRLSRGDVPRFLKALAHSAGIQKHVTPHLLRHTFCTNLRNNGADISLIKELAGHQEIQTTARYYLGTDTEVLKQAVGRYLDYSAPKAEEPAAAPSTS